MVTEQLQFECLRGELRHDEPLARRTTWRCGGRADRFYVPAGREDLALFMRQLAADEPVTMLGLGSNLLVRDGGVRGTVILMHTALTDLQLRDGLVFAGAGVAAPKVARFAANHERAEAEFLAGIPGTIGGALAMNAGCYGGETWRYVARVEILTRSGTFEQRLPSEYVIGYRSVRRADTRAKEAIFTAAWFAFPPGDVAARARPDQPLAAATDRHPAARATQCRQRISQPGMRSRGAADRGVWSQGLCDRRRPRFRKARQFHRQSGGPRERGGHRGVDCACTRNSAREDGGRSPAGSGNHRRGGVMSAVIRAAGPSQGANCTASAGSGAAQAASAEALR